MLIRRVLVGVLLIAGLGTAPGTAWAAPGYCDKSTNPWCGVEEGRPGERGGSGGNGGGGGSGCSWNGVPMPCTDPDFGFYVGNGCYWESLGTPAPISLPPVPEGKDPARGQWGTLSCYAYPGAGGVAQAPHWLETGAGPTAAQLAQQALAKLRLLGARIGITPSPNGSGAVGLPVWLWTAVTPGTWGPLSASASDGGVTVTITARAQRIVWDMGDGHSKTCDNAGTPYKPSYGNRMSPTCGYRYTVPSATTANPNGRFTVTATTHWRVNWSGGGQSGVLTPTSQSQTSVRIGEIPVVGR